MNAPRWQRIAALGSRTIDSGATSSSRAWVHAARALDRGDGRAKRTERARTHEHTRPGPSRERQQHRQNNQDFDDSYFLASRVKLLASRGKLDEATELVKHSPAHAATIVVWNVLINEHLNQNKLKPAYDLWMDAKRRRQRPTARSFATFLGGAARASAKHSQQPLSTISRVKTVHAQWLEHVVRLEQQQQKLGNLHHRSSRLSADFADELDSTREHKLDEDNHISALPTNHYLTFLGNVGLVDDMLEAYQALPAIGPTAATSVTHSIVLSGLRQHMQTRPELFDTALSVWKRLEDVPHGDSNQSKLDNRTVSLMISICRDAKRPDDQRIGLQVAEKYYGFVPSTQEHTLAAKTAPRPVIRLDAAALSNVLALVLKLQLFNLAVRLFNQVRDYPDRFGWDVLTHHHGDLALVAMGGKRDSAGAQDLIEWMARQGGQVRPAESTFINAMQVFWRSGDLVRAYWLLSAMLGRDVGPKKVATTSAQAPKRSLAGICPVDDRVLATFVRTALATRDRGEMSRALDALSHELDRGPTYYERAQDGFSNRGSNGHGGKGAQTAYWQLKLAEVTNQMIERVALGLGTDERLTDERKQYLHRWKEAAESLTRATGGPTSALEGATRGDGRGQFWSEENMESRRRAIQGRDNGDRERPLRGNSRSDEQIPNERSRYERHVHDKPWAERNDRAAFDHPRREQSDRPSHRQGRPDRPDRPSGRHSGNSSKRRPSEERPQLFRRNEFDDRERAWKT
ncbi:hypothetical protein ACM66B_002512 [Microbotryomycetes sp. NB124-2]